MNKIIYQLYRLIFKFQKRNSETNASGVHIDSINRSLSKQNEKWLEKSYYFFIDLAILKEQMQLPWQIFLEVNLLQRRKYKNINFSTEKQFIQELDKTTPPELYIGKGNIKYDKQHMDNTEFNFLPKNLDIFFIKTYDQDSHIYYRYLHLFFKKQSIFRVMIGSLYFGYNQKINTDESDKCIANKNEKLIKKLLSKLELEPLNYNLINEIGALYLLAFNKPDQALIYFNKSLDINRKNKATFWIAIFNYYYLNDLNKTKEILLDNKTSAELYLVLYRVICEETKSPKSGLKYLKKAIKLEPYWLLPKINLVMYYIGSNQFSLARQETINALKIDINISKSKNITDKYYSNFVTGNTKEHIEFLNTTLNFLS